MISDNVSHGPTKATLRLVLTNEFGDVTDITKDLYDGTIGSVFEAICHALAGCGYAKENIDEYFPSD